MDNFSAFVSTHSNHSSTMSLLSNNKPTLSSQFSTEQVQKICALIGLPDELENTVRIMDQNANLILLHYLDMVEGNAHIRGIIVDTSKMSIVCQSFPFTPEVEYSDNLPENVQNLIKNSDKNGLLITKATEGTIIRVFHYADEWFFSSHKKLNAYRSRWGGKATFGEIFEQAWGSNPFLVFDEKFFGKVLKPDRVHCFLVLSRDNRIVSDVSRPSLTYICAFKDGQRIYTDNAYDEFFASFYFLKPETVPVENIKDVMKTLDVSKFTGLMLTSGNTYYKLTHPEYVKRNNVRGGETSLRIRYLQLRKDQSSIGEFCLFKEIFASDLDMELIEKQIAQLPAHLENCYMQRFVRYTGYVNFPPYVFNMLKNVNESNGNNVSSEVRQKQFFSMVSNLDSLKLNFLIKFFNPKVRD